MDGIFAIDMPNGVTYIGERSYSDTSMTLDNYIAVKTEELVKLKLVHPASKAAEEYVDAKRRGRIPKGNETHPVRCWFTKEDIESAAQQDITALVEKLEKEQPVRRPEVLNQ